MFDNSVYTHSISEQEFNELFGIFYETCSHCGKIQKLHYKFGKDTRCFRMSLQGGYDWHYYNLFEANYNGCFYADFENGIIYIHMNYTETLDTANWKIFKFHCKNYSELGVYSISGTNTKRRSANASREKSITEHTA